jgi:hypothetical protein
MQKVGWRMWDAAELVGVRVYAMLGRVGWVSQSRRCLGCFLTRALDQQPTRRDLAAICCQARLIDKRCTPPSYSTNAMDGENGHGHCPLHLPPWMSRRSTRSRLPSRPRRRPSRPAISRRKTHSTSRMTSEHSARPVGGETSRCARKRSPRASTSMRATSSTTPRSF